MDRAVHQLLKESLRIGTSAGRLSQAPLPLANGAEHRAVVADTDGAARGWCCVRELSPGGRRLGEVECDQYGAHAVRETRGSTATLSTPIHGRQVGGYASGYAQRELPRILLLGTCANKQTTHLATCL